MISIESGAGKKTNEAGKKGYSYSKSVTLAEPLKAEQATQFLSQEQNLQWTLVSNRREQVETALLG